MSVNDRVVQFLTALKKISVSSSFVPGEYAKILIASARATASQVELKDFYPAEYARADVPNAQFDGVDCREIVQKLSASGIALAMAKLGDEFGFHDCPNVDVAQALGQVTLASILPLLYAEYLNKMLAAENLDNLKNMAIDKKFVEAFQTKLQSRGIIMDELRIQATNPDKAADYTLNLFFVNQYFRSGGPFHIVTHTPDSADREDPTHFTSLLHPLLEAVIQEGENTNNPNLVPNQLSILISSISYIYAPGGQLSNSVLELAKHAFPEPTGVAAQAIEALKLVNPLPKLAIELGEKAIGTYQTMGQQMQYMWVETSLEAFTNLLLPAIRTLVKTPWTYQRRWSKFGPIYATGERMEYGKAVCDHMEANQKLKIYSKGVSQNSPRVQRIRAKHKGCFAPGTKVTTSAYNTTMNIEDITEGTKILTCATSREFGIASDEVVRLPADSQLLYGFNDEIPFFTANHVFHTTTGPRAVDPEGARRENSWLKVGALRVGHSVVRIAPDGCSYETIRIDSLPWRPADFQYVYGVHLREGLRSYHANGYLVALNYPELTMASLGRMIAEIPADKQLQVLSGLRELEPLFDRFGATTTMQAFLRELEIAKLSPAEYPQVPMNQIAAGRKDQIHFHSTDCSWELIDLDSSEDKHGGKPLPTVRVCENVLLLDGDYTQRALIEEGELSWTRPIHEGCFEHGFCTLSEDMATGSGVIFYSHDPETTTVPPEDQLRYFTLIVTKRHYVAPLKAEEDEYGPQELLQVNEPRLDLESEKLEWDNTGDSRAIVAENLASNFLAMEGLATATEKKPLPEGAINAPTFRTIESYYVKYDQQSLKDDAVERPEADPQPSFQNLFKMISTVVGEDVGLPTLSYRIPALDNLRDILLEDTQRELGKPLTAVPDLYRCHMFNKEGITHVVFRIENPEAIIQAADGYEEGSVKPSYTNLSFKKIGSELTLPFVFSELHFAIPADFDDESWPGTLNEYDPLMQGTIGTLHEISVIPLDSLDADSRHAIAARTIPTSDPTLTSRSAQFTAPKFSNFDALVTPHKAPAPALQGAAVRAKSKLDIRDLHGIKLINNDITDASQRMIYRTMLYHMTENERKLMGVGSAPGIGTRPGEIPAEMADSLEGETKNWLKNTYIPAWIGGRISQIEDMVKDGVEGKMSTRDKKRFTYFLTGTGQNCLANSDHWNRLNDLASTMTIRRLNPLLDKFLEDQAIDKADDGKKWAKAYYKGLMSRINTLDDYDDPTTGYSSLQRASTILKILDPPPLIKTDKMSESDITNAPYCIRLNIHAMGNVILGTATQKQYLDDTDPSEEGKIRYKAAQEKGVAWMKNAVETLMDKLWEGSKDFGDEVSNNIRQQLVNAAKQEGYEKLKLNMRTNIETNGIYQTYLRLFTSLKSDQIAPGLSGWARAKAAAELSTNNVQFTMSKAGSILNGLLVVAAMGFLIYQAVQLFNGDTELSWTDYGRVVLSSLQLAVGTLTAGGDIYRAFTASTTLQNRNIELMQGALNNRREFVPPQLQRNVQRVLGKPKGRPGLAHTQVMRRARRIQGATVLRRGVVFQPMRPAQQRTGWSSGSNWFRGAMLILSVGFFILRFYDLITNWGSMTAKNQIFSSIILFSELVQTVAQAGVAYAAFQGAQFIAAHSTLVGVCCWLGAIIAILGLVLLIIYSFVADKPLSPVEVWVKNNSEKVANQLDDPPNPKLLWGVTPTSATEGSTSTVYITGTNTGTEEAMIPEVKLTFEAGGSDSVLFVAGQDERFEENSNGSTLQINQVQAAMKVGQDKYVATHCTVGRGVPQQGKDAASTSIGWNVTVSDGAGGESLKIPPGGVLTIAIKGVVARKGDYKFIVKEVWYHAETDYVKFENVPSSLLFKKL